MMSRKQTCILAALVLAAIAVVPAAQAQIRPSWELTGFAGGFFAGDLYTVNDARIQIKDSWTYGGRVGANLTPQFGLEASYAYGSSDLSVRQSALYSGALGDVSVHEIDLNGLFGEAFYRQAYGYFTLGIGMTIFDPNITDVSTDTKTRFATNIGLGVKYFMTPKLGLRLDGRYRLTDTNITTDSDIYCDPYWGCWSYYSTWYDSGEITLGLVYKLGGD